MFIGYNLASHAAWFVSFCFFSWFCGIEKLEEFPEDIVSLRKLDVTDFL